MPPALVLAVALLIVACAGLLAVAPSYLGMPPSSAETPGYKRRNLLERLGD